MSGRAGPERTELARKALHLSMAAVPLAWAANTVSEQQVRIGIAALAITALVAEVARRRSPAVHRAVTRLLGPLLRPNEQGSVTGATWLALGCAIAVFAFPPRAAISALWAVTVGDALAAVVGQTVSARPTARSGKTIAGSLACLLGSAFGAWWLAAATPLAATVIGIAASVAERPNAAVNDNVRVAAVAGLAAWAVGVA